MLILAKQTKLAKLTWEDDAEYSITKRPALRRAVKEKITCIILSGESSAAVADDDVNDLRGDVETLFEGFDSTAGEGVVQIVLDQVDGATAETAAHDTRTGDATLQGDVVEEVEFFAANLVVAAEAFMREVHLTAYFLVVATVERVADSEDAVFLAEDEGGALDVFGGDG